jgi:LacI family transcriptional regulator
VNAPATRPPTSHDVAVEAGVSQTTVSLVLRGAAEGRVSEQTQSKVLRAAKTLGYVPNEAGRLLRNSPSRLLALVVPDVTDPYFTAVMRGAESEAGRGGMVLSLLEARTADTMSRVIGSVRSRWMTGLIVCTPEDAQVEMLADVMDHTVLLDGYDGRAHACIQYDIADGVRQAVELLGEGGHRRIGHIASAATSSTVQTRNAAIERLVTGSPRCEVIYPLEPEVAGRQVRRFLEEHPELTAVVCDTDSLGLVVLAAASDVGIDVPEQLSVVGFNDTFEAQVARPALTSVSLPMEEAGALATRLLLARRPDPHHVVLPATLSVRASTAPVGTRRRAG